MKTLRPMRTLLISTHPDDVAYSIGATVLTKFFSRPMMLVTIFTKSTYAPFAKTSKNSKNVTKLRRREDTRFAKAIGVTLHRFDFPDTTLRGYPDLESIFYVPRGDLDPVFPSVFNALKEFFSLFPNAKIVAPLGVGNHVDHLIVSEICVKIGKEQERELVFFEDLPYSGWYSLEEVENRIKLLNLHLHPKTLDVTKLFPVKLKNLNLYSSQVGKKELDAVELHARRLRLRSGMFAERLWVSTSRHMNRALRKNSKMQETAK